MNKLINYYKNENTKQKNPTLIEDYTKEGA